MSDEEIINTANFIFPEVTFNSGKHQLREAAVHSCSINTPKITQTSLKSVFCVYMKNRLLLPSQDSANFHINDRSYFANTAMKISTFGKALELMTKGNQIFSLKDKL